MSSCVEFLTKRGICTSTHQTRTLLGKSGVEATYVLPLDGLPPEVCPRIIVRRLSGTSSLLGILLHNPDNLRLNVLERVERDMRDLAGPAVFLEPETSPGEEDIGLAGGGKVRDTFSDEHDEGYRAVFTLR